MTQLLLVAASAAGAAVLANRQGIDVSHGAAAGAGIYVCSILLYKFLYAMIYPYWFSPLRNLPTPEGSNIFTGHALKIYLGRTPFDYYFPWSRRWEKEPFIRHFGFGNEEVLLPNTIGAIRGVMHTYGYTFDKSPFMKNIFKDYCKGGVLFAMGEDHKRLRKILSGPVSKPSVRKLLDTFKVAALDFTDRVNESIASPKKGVIEIEEFYSELGLDVVGLTIIGKRLSDIKSKDAGLTFEQCYHVFFQPSTAEKIIMYFNTLVPLRWLPLEANRKYFEADREVRSMLMDLLRERTEELARGEGRQDLLTKMIEANIAENKLISDEELEDTLVQLVLAGHETTSGTMSWATCKLVQRPDVVARLRDEIALTRKERGSHDLDAPSIEGMPIMHNFLREVLRLHNPATILHWEPVQDIVIEDVKIPKGTSVHIVAAMIHRNRDIWGEDADIFDLDRWDRLTEKSGNVFAFEPFINGPRICPGASFAMLELKVLLIELLDKFDMEFEDPNKVVEFDHPRVTLKAKGGLPIRFKPRGKVAN